MSGFHAEVAAHHQRAAAATLRDLVVIFGFSTRQAEAAVAAIGDKSDVQLAYNYLLDHGK